MRRLVVLLVAMLALTMSTAALAQGNGRSGVTRLDKVTDAGMNGRVVMTENGDTTTISIRLQGRPSTQAMSATIRVGGCDAGREIAYRLKDVVRNASETTIQATPDQVMGTGRYIYIARSEGNGEVPISCGSLDTITRGNGEGPFIVAGEGRSFAPGGGIGGGDAGAGGGMGSADAGIGGGVEPMGGDDPMGGDGPNLPNTGSGGAPQQQDVSNLAALGMIVTTMTLLSLRYRRTRSR